MPGMDGFQTCLQLKQNVATQNIPVIFLTAKNEAMDVVRGLKLGAVDYVTKPFNRLELSARVTGISQLTRRLEERTAMLEQTTRGAREEAELKSRTSHLTLTIPSHISQVVQLRDYLNGCYVGVCQLRNIDLMSLDLCVSEALANAVIHGNLEVPSSLKQDDWEKFDELVTERQRLAEYASREVTCDYKVNEHAIRINIQDQGTGFDPAGLPDPNDPEAMLTSGRGILLIRSFMDEVSWNNSGNQITMTKRFQ
jgi:CheY-like chemotaxis protein